MYNVTGLNNQIGLQSISQGTSIYGTHPPRISQLTIADETHLPRVRPSTIPDEIHPPGISQLTIADGTHPPRIRQLTITDGTNYRPPCLGDYQALIGHDSGIPECSKARRKSKRGWIRYERGRFGFGLSKRGRLTFRMRGPRLKIGRFIQVALWPFGRNADWWG